MSLRLAVATEDFGTPLRRAIPLAGKAQVPGIRLNARRDILAENMSASGLKQLAQYIRENRMQVAGLNCPTRHSLAAPEFLEERVQLIRSAMELARPLQTSSLIVPCGLIPDPEQADPAPDDSNSSIDQQVNPFSFATAGSSDSMTPTSADQFGTLCEVVSDLARHGNHVGCTLTLQLANYDIALIERLMTAVITEPLQIVFDPAVTVFTGGDAILTYRNVYSHVGYVRARDGIRNSDFSGTETAVGDGTVNWEELLPTLIEADFAHWVCIERTGGDHRETDVLNSVARIKSLLPRPADG